MEEIDVEMSENIGDEMETMLKPKKNDEECLMMVVFVFDMNEDDMDSKDNDTIRLLVIVG